MGGGQRACVCVMSADGCLSFPQVILCSFGFRLGPTQALLLLRDFLAFCQHLLVPSFGLVLGCLLAARYCAECFTHLISVNPQN